MKRLEIGQAVWIKSSAKRYHDGPGIIRQIDPMPNASKRYFIERISEPPGQGLRKFWAARGEFELADNQQKRKET